MIWEYQCKECGITFQTSDPNEKAAMDQVCGYGLYHNFDPTPCNGLIKRVFSFSIARSMPAHYNQSAGQYISNERELKDVFKAQSEAATERTGIEHHFIPVDPQDKERLGVTSAGLAETYERRKALNMPIPDVVRPRNLD